MRADRLSKLASFLETRVRDENFDMVEFASPGFVKGFFESGDQTDLLGMCACAVGYTAYLYKNKGLYLKVYGELVGIHSSKSALTGESLVQEFFDISKPTYVNIFRPESYKGRTATPKEVAQRIHTLLQTHSQKASA